MRVRDSERPEDTVKVCGEDVSLEKLWGRAGDGAGDEHWACCIEPSDLEIVKPIFHSWVATTCAAARRATGSPLWLGRPGWMSPAHIVASWGLILSCSRTAVETQDPRAGLGSIAAWRVTSRAWVADLPGHVRGMAGIMSADCQGPCPLSPGGAPHPSEATLNSTSSSQTRRGPTALGVDRSWPSSPCGPPLSFFQRRSSQGLCLR